MVGMYLIKMTCVCISEETDLDQEFTLIVDFVSQEKYDRLNEIDIDEYFDGITDLLYVETGQKLILTDVAESEVLNDSDYYDHKNKIISWSN
jgi:hypothetical protein